MSMGGMKTPIPQMGSVGGLTIPDIFTDDLVIDYDPATAGLYDANLNVCNGRLFTNIGTVGDKYIYLLKSATFKFETTPGNYIMAMAFLTDNTAFGIASPCIAKSPYVPQTNLRQKCPFVFSTWFRGGLNVFVGCCRQSVSTRQSRVANSEIDQVTVAFSSNPIMGASSLDNNGYAYPTKIEYLRCRIIA